MASHKLLFSRGRPAGLALLAAVATVTMACGEASPTSPGKGHQPAAMPTPTPSSGSFATTGRVFDALTQAGLGSIAIEATGLRATSDAGGSFSLFGPNSHPDPRVITFTGPGVVTRQTYLRLPGAPTNVSLISGGFDLAAFNQMVRVSQLQRWTTPPPLLIETRALQFSDVNASSAIGVSDVMSDTEYDDLVADLAQALPALSGLSFSGFANITRQNSADGSAVTLLTSGRITVARVVGLTSATGFWGYGRWQTQSDGTVVGGNIVLDRDFERSGSAFLGSLRAHELGHAMGYDHVTIRPSVMNSTARLQPNAFDIDALRIAFQRRPGNRMPDTDLSSASLNALPSTLTWGPPIR